MGRMDNKTTSLPRDDRTTGEGGAKNRKTTNLLETKRKTAAADRAKRMVS
jgi:hypothetical protein